MSILQRIFSRKESSAAWVIDSPKFGILNLKGDIATSIVAQDTNALLPVLGQPNTSVSVAPPCNVFFLYCDIGLDGRIRGTEEGLHELIRDSGAVVVVVASENDGNAYNAAGNHTGYGRANLVMTLQRKGDAFPNFFARLFAEMKAGMTMPLAWVKLAPQIPGHDHSDCPGTIFACEAGQMAFK
jgi:hypothetical protein